MSEIPEPSTVPHPVAAPPPPRVKRRALRGRAWVVIVAGIVFILSVVFFAVPSSWGPATTPSPGMMFNREGPGDGGRPWRFADQVAQDGNSVHPGVRLRPSGPGGPGGPAQSPLTSAPASPPSPAPALPTAPLAPTWIQIRAPGYPSTNDEALHHHGRRYPRTQ